MGPMNQEGLDADLLYTGHCNVVLQNYHQSLFYDKMAQHGSTAANPSLVSQCPQTFQPPLLGILY